MNICSPEQSTALSTHLSRTRAHIHPRRRHAEAQLTQAEIEPGFRLALIDIFSEGAVEGVQGSAFDCQTRMAAVLYFKNAIVRFLPPLYRPNASPELLAEKEAIKGEFRLLSLHLRFASFAGSTCERAPKRARDSITMFAPIFPFAKAHSPATLKDTHLTIVHAWCHSRPHSIALAVGFAGAAAETDRSPGECDCIAWGAVYVRAWRRFRCCDLSCLNNLCVHLPVILDTCNSARLSSFLCI